MRLVAVAWDHVGMLELTARDVDYEPDHRKTPQPDQDSHWWRVRVPGGRTGWAFTGGSLLPVPGPEWVAGELRRLAPILGDALTARLLSRDGFELHPPRADGSAPT
jgi:hypothetical protein